MDVERRVKLHAQRRSLRRFNGVSLGGESDNLDKSDGHDTENDRFR